MSAQPWPSVDDFASKPCDSHNGCVRQVVEQLLHSLSGADSYSRCQTGFSETKALERRHSPTTVSLSPESPSCWTHSLQAGLWQEPEGEGIQHLPGLTYKPSPQRDLLHQIICYCKHSQWPSEDLPSHDHPAKERILKADHYTSLELWNLQLLLPLLPFSPTSFFLCLECNQSRKIRSVSSPHSSRYELRWKWTLHSLDLLKLVQGFYIFTSDIRIFKMYAFIHIYTRLQKSACLKAVCGTTVELHSVLHSHPPIPALCSAIISH